MVGSIGSSLGALTEVARSTETLAKKAANPLGSPQGADPVEVTTGLMRNQREVQANVKAIRTADEMVGTVLNLKA